MGMTTGLWTPAAAALIDPRVEDAELTGGRAMTIHEIASVIRGSAIVVDGRVVAKTHDRAIAVRRRIARRWSAE